MVHVEPPPLRVVTKTLPNARIGVPYEAELRVNGGVAPLRWSGEPPAGLQFGDGLLYGTPHGPSAAAGGRHAPCATRPARVRSRRSR